MQPQTEMKLDRAAFERKKRALGDLAIAAQRRRRNPRYAAPAPREVGIQLVHACNLRCTTCFQWHENGFFHHMSVEQQKARVSVDLVAKILRETREANANLYLWGGEPLVHRDWDAITRVLAEDPRWTVLCTNGVLLERKLESILRISEHLVLLVSLDGLREENDAVRGKGTFDSVMRNLKLLFELQEKGEYRGKISLNCVLSNQNVSRLYEMAEFAEGLPIDSLYFCFPWYISKPTARAMDDFYHQHLSWLGTWPQDAAPSWHSYDYHLEPEALATVYRQLDRLSARSWKMRIRIQPALETDEVEDFVLGSSRPGQRRRSCFSISNRMDVLADGTVSACKLFPEFHVGNLNDQGVVELWQSERFGRFRELISGGLMPICSKCILLYLHGR